MYMLKTLARWGWCAALILVVAVVGSIYGWPVEVVAPMAAVILVIGVVVAVLGTREKKLELLSLRLRQLAEYFNRRFMGNSSLSIFAIIDSLFNVDDPKLWDWARACDMAQRVFNTWCSSFADRLGSDFRTRRFNFYLRIYLNELWLANNHYFEFVEQFREVAEKVDVPRETIDQYNRFVDEYNAFIQNFQEIITELKMVARTEIEPPSAKPARKVTGPKPPQ